MMTARSIFLISSFFLGSGSGCAEVNAAELGSTRAGTLFDYSDNWTPGSSTGVYQVDDLIRFLEFKTLEMVNVPSGTFIMGRSEEGDDAAYGGVYGGLTELPRHQVTYPTYEIGKFEVTNEQYANALNWAFVRGYLNDSKGWTYTGGDVYTKGVPLLCVSAAACQITFASGLFVSESRQGRSMANHPVVEVTWFGAVAFCNWLSQIKGFDLCYDTETWTLIDRFKSGFRLPSESEWERAAGWGGSRHWIYGFLSDSLTGKDRCNHYDGNPTIVNPLGLSESPYTSPVGWFNGVNVSPNGSIKTQSSLSPVGCYDMSGNVWEWCEDWYHRTYRGAPSDGSAWSVPEYGGSDSRVRRGGGWGHIAENCRSARRGRNHPTLANDITGFRVARTP